MYNWLSLAEVLKYENEMKREKVSIIARGKNGFLGQYKKYKMANVMKNKIVPSENITWETKRNAYLARSYAGYKLNPTYRRWLSLISWGYMPKKLH